MDSVLFGSEENDFLALLMNMTWRCNLRCTHCFVLDKLVKEDTSKLNLPHFIDFVDRYKKRFPKVHTISVHFVGGEVSLISEECLAVIYGLKETFPETTFTFSTTINGTILDEPTIELIEQCDRINVSLDGNREANNAQRKSLDGFDPYQKTVENLKNLMALGFRDKISVQASMTEKHMRDRQALEQRCSLKNAKPVQMKDWYVGADGLTMDQIIRYENYQQEVSLLLALFGYTDPLPHVNRSDGRLPYTAYYDNETRHRVADLYAADLECWGYDF